jgi:hypothetical protein
MEYRKRQTSTMFYKFVSTGTTNTRGTLHVIGR